MRRKKERDEAKKRTVNKEVVEEATKTQPQGTRSSILGLQRKVGNRVFAEMLHGRDRDEKDSVPRIVEEVLSSRSRLTRPCAS